MRTNLAKTIATKTTYTHYFERTHHIPCSLCLSPSSVRVIFMTLIRMHGAHEAVAIHIYIDFSTMDYSRLGQVEPKLEFERRGGVIVSFSCICLSETCKLFRIKTDANASAWGFDCTQYTQQTTKLHFSHTSRTHNGPSHNNASRTTRICLAEHRVCQCSPTRAVNWMKIQLMQPNR